ncbi:MAG TPA: Gfo/Idh/MocA family oxidoreductase [Terrimicrobiaceae bacterium]|nr:Gfo/Idh/MocA family oxidoreductase [Terrimicrobiaceae bacterium]
MRKPLRLGIIGAENSHSWAISEVCNIQRKVPLRVTHLWGETRQAARFSAQKGAIAHVVSDWREMAGQVDGIMIDHRDGAHHAKAARFFIKTGIPVFIDKPITRNLQEAKSLFVAAKKYRTPIATYGIIPLQKRFCAFKATLHAQNPIRFINMVGPADIAGPYGGIFYYAFHQVEAAIDFLGTDIESAALRRCGENGIATVLFKGNRSATLHFLKSDWKGFQFEVCQGAALHHIDAKFDPSPYLTAAKVLHDFLRTGNAPHSQQRMLAPIAVLQTLVKSLSTGRTEKIPAF